MAVFVVFVAESHYPGDITLHARMRKRSLGKVAHIMLMAASGSVSRETNAHKYRVLALCPLAVIHSA